ncbi:MAG: imidazoleglycerol-phosphate dehydratase HisB [Myxococcota bacterium]
MSAKDGETAPAAAPRKAEVSRITKETDIELALALDGRGQISVRTGLGFYDHMLTSWATHGGFDLQLQCEGDLHVDDHHTVEDCALALGEALDTALGDRRDIERFGDALVPMDEALARAAVDLVRRPYAVVHLGFKRPQIGQVATEMLTHALQSLTVAGRFTMHVDVLRGDNDHHRAEAAFKASARALRAAVRPRAGAGAPSTKGVM